MMNKTKRKSFFILSVAGLMFFFSLFVFSACGTRDLGVLLSETEKAEILAADSDEMLALQATSAWTGLHLQIKWDYFLRMTGKNWYEVKQITNMDSKSRYAEMESVGSMTDVLSYRDKKYSISETETEDAYTTSGLTYSRTKSESNPYTFAKEISDEEIGIVGLREMIQPANISSIYKKTKSNTSFDVNMVPDIDAILSEFNSESELPLVVELFAAVYGLDTDVVITLSYQDGLVTKMAVTIKSSAEYENEGENFKEKVKITLTLKEYAQPITAPGWFNSSAAQSAFAPKNVNYVNGGTFTISKTSQLFIGDTITASKTELAKNETVASFIAGGYAIIDAYITDDHAVPSPISTAVMQGNNFVITFTGAVHTVTSGKIAVVLFNDANQSQQIVFIPYLG